MDESAHKRALTDLQRVTHSLQWLLLTVLADGVGAAVTGAALISASRATAGVILVMFGAVVGGTVLSIGGVYMFQLLRAPYRQRNQARSALAERRSDWDVELGQLLAVGRYRDDSTDHLLSIHLRFTNRHREDRVNLNAELVWQLTARGERLGNGLTFFRELHQSFDDQLNPPLDIGPQETISGPLAFRATEAEQRFLRFEDYTVLVRPKTVIYLRLHDYVSGESCEYPIDLAEWSEDTQG